MNRKCIIILFSLLAFSARSLSEVKQSNNREEYIIPPPTDYSFNQYWINPPLCGKNFWLTNYHVNNGEEAPMKQLGHADRLGWKSSCYGKNTDLKNPVSKERFEKVKKGEIPWISNVIVFPGKAKWNGKSFVRKNFSEEDFAWMAEDLPDSFLGYGMFCEWGWQFYLMHQFALGREAPTRMYILKEHAKAFEAPFDTREGFAKNAARFWKLINEPFNYQVMALDGTSYWAVQWPAILGACSVITENRVPGKNIPTFQAITRGAGRMGQIPWGYWPASDWHTAPVPDILKSIRRPGISRRQKAVGWLNISPSLYRRSAYYMLMGGARIVADECGHRRYIDLEGDGNYHLSWYGHIWNEVLDFSETFPQRGVPYTPIGILLSWDNGTEPCGSRAFEEFEYKDGEHMTREFLNRVLYDYKEDKSANDMFTATPYGDLYDILRIDTPKGALPLKLLENYKVLFCIGNQNLSQAVVSVLKQYVENGGTLVLNTKQLNGEFDEKFLGVKLAPKEKDADELISELNGKILKSGKFSYTPLLPGNNTRSLYKSNDGDSVVSRHPFGKGFVIVTGAHWMLENRKERGRRETRAFMLPLAGDMLEHFIKSLLPFKISGKNVKEQLLYQVNRKGDGWLISLYNNGGRESRKAAGPEIVYPDKYIDVELTVADDIKDAVELTEKEQLYFEGNNRKLNIHLPPGELKIIEIQPHKIAPVQVEEKLNLALNKTVKASSSKKTSNTPEQAVDGEMSIYNGWWSTGNCPQWLEVDLGKIESINSVKVTMMWSEDNSIFPRIYDYRIESSADGKNWQSLFEEKYSRTPASKHGHHRYFDPVKARYIKITVTHNTALTGAQLVELGVYGDEKAIKTYRWKKDPSKIKIPDEVSAATQKKYLSDMTPESVNQDYKCLVNDAECIKEESISIRRKKFQKGLGTHANSEIIYRLPKDENWKYFVAHVGIDDNSIPLGSVEFIVYIDGIEKTRSGRITMKNKPVPLWTSVEGAKELKLVVNDCGDGAQGDIADWANARLVK